MSDKYAERARAAVAEWEAMGAPIRYPGQHPDDRDLQKEEASRQSIRDWAEGRRGAGDQNVSKAVLAGVLMYIEQERMARANNARREVIQARSRRRAQENADVIDEMVAIREHLDLSQAEMNAHLRLKAGVIHNAENRRSGYSLDARKALLDSYRAAAKLAGGKAPKAKAAPTKA